ncbi:recombinase family protein [Glycocaulis profundi]|nr:recombinase family protein [Glycocaulis profundi]
MIIGYARTSTFDQVAGLEAQLNELKAAGAEKVFQERVSSVAGRDQLAAALDFIRENDVLMVTKLDRLARSVADLMKIIETIRHRGASLKILAIGMETETATGKLMMGVMASVAEFEREIMLERQREGIAKAKAAGKFKGRAPTARRKADQVIALISAGHTEQQVADEVGISRSSVQRIKRNQSNPEE